MLISVISPNCEEAKEKNGGFDFLFVFALICSRYEQQFIQKTLCTDINDTYGSAVSSYEIILDSVFTKGTATYAIINNIMLFNSVFLFQCQ